VLDARLFRIMAMFELGDIQQADVEIAAFRSEAAELRQPYYLWYAAMLPATRALVDGSFAAAEKLAEEALAVGERARDPAAIVIYGAQMLWSWREQGRTAELEVAMASILDVASAIPIAHVAMAWVSAELGQLDDARKQLESLKMLESTEGATHHSAPGWMAGAMMKADLAHALDDAGYAAVVYAELQKYAGHTVMVWLAFCGGPVDYYLGLLAATMGRLEMARNHFDSARRLARAMGARPMVAHIEHAHAKLILRTGTRTGDPDAAELIARAGAIAGELGMVPLTAAVEELR
jgi:tetratricopeptide (TPR) repeat protein